MIDILLIIYVFAVSDYSFDINLGCEMCRFTVNPFIQFAIVDCLNLGPALHSGLLICKVSW